MISRKLLDGELPILMDLMALEAFLMETFFPLDAEILAQKEMNSCFFFRVFDVELWVATTYSSHGS